MYSPVTTFFLKRLLLISFLLTLSIPATTQGIIPDSLKLLLERTPDKEKIDVYQTIVTKIWRSNPDSALVYSKKAIQFAQNLNDYRARAIAVRLCGGSFFYLGNYDSSVFYTNQARRLSIESGDSSLIASSLSNLGEVYVLMGNYPEGLENLLQALNIKRSINQKYGLANTLNNISVAYLKLKDYTKAREYALEAITVADQLGDNNPKLYASNNLGFSYLFTGDLREAERYFRQSISISEKKYNLNWFAAAYSGLGQVYLQLNRLTEARTYFKEALNLYVKINDKVGVSEMYLLISKIHSKSGSLDSAFFYVSLSKKSAEATGSMERRLESFKLLVDIYTQQKKYDSALFFKSRSMELRDSMFNETMMRTLANIELKVSEEKTQRALAGKDILIQKKTYQTYFLIVIILIIVFSSVILFRSYRLIKERTHELARSKEEIQRKAELLEKANNEIRLINEKLKQQTEEIMAQRDSLSDAQKIIESKNKDLEEVNVVLEKKVMLRTKELNIANQDLIETNKDLDQFIYRSSHDLKGPLTRLIGLCHLGKVDTQETQAKEYFEMLELTAHEMNAMLTKLINIHGISIRTITDAPVNLKAKVVDLFSNINRKLKNNGIVRLDNKISDDLILNTDPDLIESLFTIIIENAIQYRDPEKKEQFLEISASHSNGSMQVFFTDNGIGIPHELAEKLFDMFVIGENNRKGHGLGLYEAKIIVKKLKGNISLVNSNAGLTQFNVTLPLPG